MTMFIRAAIPIIIGIAGHLVATHSALLTINFMNKWGVFVRCVIMIFRIKGFYNIIKKYIDIVLCFF